MKVLKITMNNYSNKRRENAFRNAFFSEISGYEKDGYREIYKGLYRGEAFHMFKHSVTNKILQVYGNFDTYVIRILVGGKVVKVIDYL